MKKILFSLMIAGVLSGCKGLPQYHSAEYDAISQVNSDFNRLPYITDMDNYGVEEYYATTDEFLRNGGDCEDYSIAKYNMLRTMGYSPDQLWLVNGYTDDGSHNVLMVTGHNGFTYILDSSYRSPYIPRYGMAFTPVGRFNENSAERFDSSNFFGGTTKVKLEPEFRATLNRVLNSEGVK